MIKFRAYPQITIESGHVTADALISIRGPDSPKPIIPSDQFNDKILYLTFDDVAVQHYNAENRNYIGPTDTHLQLGYEFLDKLGTFNNIAVHCKQGRSRSTAIAIALSYYVHGRDSEMACINDVLSTDLQKQMCPNPLIIKFADATWGSTLDEHLCVLSPQYLTWRKYWVDKGFKPLS